MIDVAQLKESKFHIFTDRRINGRLLVNAEQSLTHALHYHNSLFSEYLFLLLYSYKILVFDSFQV